MNSDSYQHKQVTGGSDTAGEEMETGKDISNVSHKHTVLILAGSLLALLFWIAMADHSGGARGGQYATASGDGMTQEGGGALAADLFKLGSEVEKPNDKCGPDCQGLVAKVRAASKDPPMCEKSLFNTINGVEYCFAPCNTDPKSNWCDGDKLWEMNLSSVVSMFTGGGGGCVTEYCQTGYGNNKYGWGYVDVCPSTGKWDYAAYLCQKQPAVEVPAPYGGQDYWCDGSNTWIGPDKKEYCWSSCGTASGNRSCARKPGFWRLGEYRRHCHVAGQNTNLCQKS